MTYYTQVQAFLIDITMHLYCLLFLVNHVKSLHIISKRNNRVLLDLQRSVDLPTLAHHASRFLIETYFITW